MPPPPSTLKELIYTARANGGPGFGRLAKPKAATTAREKAFAAIYKTTAVLAIASSVRYAINVSRREDLTTDEKVALLTATISQHVFQEALGPGIAIQLIEQESRLRTEAQKAAYIAAVVRELKSLVLVYHDPSPRSLKPVIPTS